MEVGVDLTAIAAVQNAYAVAIDSRDWTLLRGCFTPDAEISFGWKLELGTLEEFLDWAPTFHAAFGPTLHQISTHRATVDGDEAKAGCYLHAVLVKPALNEATTILGEYTDALRRVGGAWYIRRRIFRPIWSQGSKSARVQQE